MLDSAQPYMQFKGVSQIEAEALFGSATAAVYYPDAGEVRMLSVDNLEMARFWLTRQAEEGNKQALALKSLSPGGFDERLVATGSMSLRRFLDGLPTETTKAETGDERLYLAKIPSMSETDQNPPSPPQPLPVIEKTLESYYLYQDFEGDVWSYWTRSDNTGGQYSWGIRSCDSYSGSYSADAARGGSQGATLSCSASYPKNTEMCMTAEACAAVHLHLPDQPDLGNDLQLRWLTDLQPLHDIELLLVSIIRRFLAPYRERIQWHGQQNNHLLSGCQHHHLTTHRSHHGRRPHVHAHSRGGTRMRLLHLPNLAHPPCRQ
jgi:hypothetical protein